MIWWIILGVIILCLLIIAYYIMELSNEPYSFWEYIMCVMSIPYIGVMFLLGTIAYLLDINIFKKKQK